MFIDDVSYKFLDNPAEKMYKKIENRFFRIFSIRHHFLLAFMKKFMNFYHNIL